MKLNVFVVFFAPTVLATTKVWNLSGSCNSANVCDVDTAFNNPNNPKYRLFIAGWKRLPVPVANLLGPPLVRGLG